VSDVRLALLSDVHGNTHALDAVLADIERVGRVDEVWALGDLVAIGPDPGGVLDRLTALPAVRFVRGNTERYVATGERPPPTADDVAARPALAPVFAEVAASFAWTEGALAGTPWCDWLGALPVEQRRELPDGTRLLGVHADPSRDDGPGLGPHVDADAVAAGQADLVCGGHTHRAYDGMVGATRIVNLGSVSNPLGHDLRASYVIVDASATGYRVEHRRVDYDRQAVVDQLERLRHPGRAWIVKHLRGELP
jgi:predicted phosphodiesterase